MFNAQPVFAYARVSETSDAFHEDDTPSRVGLTLVALVVISAVCLPFRLAYPVLSYIPLAYSHSHYLEFSYCITCNLIAMLSISVKLE